MRFWYLVGWEEAYCIPRLTDGGRFLYVCVSSVMKCYVLLILPLFGFLLFSCGGVSSFSEVSPVPVNESVSEYMNPRGYSYAVVDRVCDRNP